MDISLDYEYPHIIARACTNSGLRILGRSEKWLDIAEAQRLCDLADQCNATVGPVAPVLRVEKREEEERHG